MNVFARYTNIYSLVYPYYKNLSTVDSNLTWYLTTRIDSSVLLCKSIVLQFFYQIIRSLFTFTPPAIFRFGRENDRYSYLATDISHSKSIIFVPYKSIMPTCSAEMVPWALSRFDDKGLFFDYQSTKRFSLRITCNHLFEKGKSSP